MTPFTVTRPEPETESNILKKTYTCFQHKWIPLEQHVNSENHGAIATTQETSTFLPSDIHLDYNDYLNDFSSRAQLHIKNTDLDSRFDFYDWEHVDSYLPEKNVTALYTSTEIPKDGVSTATCSAIDIFDSDSKYYSTFLPEEKTLSVGGILTWQQSIFPDRYPKSNNLIDFDASHSSFKDSSVCKSLVNHMASPLLTEKNHGTQAKRQRLSPSTGNDVNTYYIDPNVSAPYIDYSSCTDNQFLNQNRKRSNSLERYFYVNSNSKGRLNSPLSDESYHEYSSSRSDTDSYKLVDNVGDVLPKSFSETFSSSHNCQMLLAMPRRQKQRYDGDHYTPKWVRYTGHLKEGYCDSCIPGKWLQLKNSAYWYHKQFYHGISSVTGKPFKKPVEQRLGKGSLTEGLCHQCNRFVPVCNSKKKNNYMLWYRHAHKCHLHDKSKIFSK